MIKFFKFLFKSVFYLVKGSPTLLFNRDSYSDKRKIIDAGSMNINSFINSPVVPKYFELIFGSLFTKGKGLILEFGVWRGTSINIIAASFPLETVYGFDSFEGLPENWIKNRGRIDFPKGSFKTDKLIIPFENVSLVKGLFHNSLPNWLKENPGEVKFIHIDCDLYSSTKTILTLLNERITKGTVIIFDEIYRWDKDTVFSEKDHFEIWEEHEWKALCEWMKEYNRKIKVLFRNNWEAMVVVVVG